MSGAAFTTELISRMILCISVLSGSLKEFPSRSVFLFTLLIYGLRYLLHPAPALSMSAPLSAEAFFRLCTSAPVSSVVD